MALDQNKGVWKSAKGKGRRTPKGRQFEDEALSEVKSLLANRPRQKDLLIEFLHLIQDKYGYLSAQHLCALAEELKLSMAEVYEVASFYAHFDIVKEDETPPPKLTIRVCDSLSCELAGAQKLREELQKGFKDLFICIINRDTKGIVNILIGLGVIVPTSSDVADIELFFENILGYLETLDGGAILNDDLATELAMEKPFVVPTSFVYLAKSFSLIEGICLQLDPDFDYFTYLEPMIQQQFIESIDIGEILMTTTTIPSTIGKINASVVGLEKSRAAMKRSISKTRQDIQVVQYSVVCALLAQQLGDTPLAMIFVLCTLWFTFRKGRSK